MAERDGLQYLGKRSDGAHVWRVRPYVGKPRRRVSDTFDMPSASVKAARTEAVKVVERLRNAAVARDAARGTVGGILTDWLERGAATKSPKTLHEYERRVKRIRARFGRTEVGALTPDMVDAWYAEMRAGGTSAAEVLELHRVFNAALRWARKLRRIPEAVTEVVDRPKHSAPEITPPSAERMRSIMTALPDHEWARCVALLALTGMRRGEVVGLRWADIHDSHVWVRHSVLEIPGTEGVIVQPFPKGKRERRVDISPHAAAVLNQQRIHCEAQNRKLSEWVFPDWESWRLSKPRTPSSVSRAWSRFRLKHDARDIRPHDLRHMYATIAIERGDSVKAIAKQLGHADAATTLRIYSHATAAGTRQVADGVGAALSPAPAVPPE